MQFIQVFYHTLVALHEFNKYLFNLTTNTTALKQFLYTTDLPEAPISVSSNALTHE